MTCIGYHSPILPVLSQFKHRQRLKAPNLLWLTTGNEPIVSLQGQRFPSASPVRTRAIYPSLVLGITSPAKSGDITVLLQIGTGLFFVYWIANFVVPEFIYKDLQSDNSSEDQEPNGENTPENKKGSSTQTEKQGFSGTKR